MRNTEITIIRSRKDFAQISNDILRDERLSPQALGFLVRLLSYEDEWSLSLEEIRQSFKMSKYRCLQVLAELQQFDYVDLIEEEI